MILYRDSKEELKTLLEKCREDRFFAAVEDWMLPFIIENEEIEWKLSCMKLIFPEDKKLPSCQYKSMNLSLKVGFVKDRIVHWVKRKK